MDTMRLQRYACNAYYTASPSAATNHEGFAGTTKLTHQPKLKNMMIGRLGQTLSLALPCVTTPCVLYSGVARVRRRQHTVGQYGTGPQN